MTGKTICGFFAGMMATGALQMAWQGMWWSVVAFAAFSAFFLAYAKIRNPHHD